VVIKNIINKILHVIVKHCDIPFEENVEIYVSNINFVTSDFLDVGHKKRRHFQ
jgi:hypothetical protein